MGRFNVEFDRVLFKYIRNEYDSDGSLGIILAEPFTIAFGVVQEGSSFRIALGIAKCWWQDNFSKKIGRDIALGRAKQAYRVGVSQTLVDVANNWVATITYNESDEERFTNKESDFDKLLWEKVAYTLASIIAKEFGVEKSVVQEMIVDQIYPIMVFFSGE